MGGENAFWRWACVGQVGSSPRGRGKREERFLDLVDERLIPAWAGKTDDTGGESRTIKAHPRVGGENRSQRRPGIRLSGSSPRGRGKRSRRHRDIRGRRLIPAWAGKTARALVVLAGCRAHPRVGGENARRVRHNVRDRGSSPRGRGKPRGPRRSGGWRRLIPAWAGKTSRQHRRRRDRGAHPRVGGENTPPGPTAEGEVGSSPRGRGKRRWPGLSRRGAGLIPAWAGKTARLFSNRAFMTAHPRVGGENRSLRTFAVWVSGSSPRGRGKRARSSVFRWRRGLIPAWAGKTRRAQAMHSWVRAHPRVGGENMLGAAVIVDWDGSSPRGRGKRKMRV